MANDLKTNKNSASEDDLGHGHKQLTRIYNAWLDAIVEKLNAGADPLSLVLPKDLDSIAKWVTDRNKITSTAPEESEESELGKKLAEVRKRSNARMDGNVVQLLDEFDDE